MRHLACVREDPETDEEVRVHVREFGPRGEYLVAGVSHFQSQSQFLMDEELLDKLSHLTLPNSYDPSEQFVATIVKHSPREGWSADRFTSYDEAKAAWKKVKPYLGAELWCKFMIASPVSGNDVLVDGYVWRKAASWGNIRVNALNPAYVKERFLNTVPDFGTRENYASYDKESSNVGAYRKLWELSVGRDSTAPDARVDDPLPPRHASIVACKAWNSKTYGVLIREEKESRRRSFPRRDFRRFSEEGDDDDDEGYWVVYEADSKSGYVHRRPLGAWIDAQLERPGAATRFRVSSDPSDFNKKKRVFSFFRGDDHLQKMRNSLTGRHPEEVRDLCENAVSKLQVFAKPKDFALFALFDLKADITATHGVGNKNHQKNNNNKAPLY